MKIKISADSTCDMSPELAERYDINIVPLYILKGDEMLRDTVEITTDDLFKNYEEGNGRCSTSALGIVDYHEVFEQYAHDYDAVFQFIISSDMSACYQNAVLAAQEYENVYVVDSRNLSTGIGHLALEAVRMAGQGRDAREIYKYVLALREKLDVSFVISTLDYLRAGGRCTAVEAIGANLFRIKPCIEVIDGKMTVGKKYRGTMEKVLEQYITDRLQGRDDIRTDKIFITSSSDDPELYEYASEVVSRFVKFDEVFFTRAGCTVASHCGPGTLGILFIKNN